LRSAAFNCERLTSSLSAKSSPVVVDVNIL
jgi:hypothetical protein